LGTLTGEWKFKSVSSSNPNDIRRGTCNIVKNQGALKLNGNFLENENPVGNWESGMYKLGDSRLDFFYELHELKQGQQELSNGICTLTFGSVSEKISEMDGIWILVGKQKAAGSITFSRI
jgi:hypothetical protein